jgi:hypothetical protein
MNTSGRVQKKVAKFANHANDSIWKTLVRRRKIARTSVYAPYSKHAPENGHGNLYETG